MKRLLAWIFVLPLAVGLAACAGENNDADEKQQAAASSDKSQQEQQPKSPSKSLTRKQTDSSSGNQPQLLSKEGTANPSTPTPPQLPVTIQSKQDWDKLGLPPETWTPVARNLTNLSPTCPWKVTRIWKNRIVSMHPQGDIQVCDANATGQGEVFLNRDGQWIFMYRGDPEYCYKLDDMRVPLDAPEDAMSSICDLGNGRGVTTYRDYLKQRGR